MFNTFKPIKIQYFPHYYSDKGFKNTFAVSLSLIKIQLWEFFVSNSKSVKDCYSLIFKTAVITKNPSFYRW